MWPLMKTNCGDFTKGRRILYSIVNFTREHVFLLYGSYSDPHVFSVKSSHGLLIVFK